MLNFFHNILEITIEVFLFAFFFTKSDNQFLY